MPMDHLEMKRAELSDMETVRAILLDATRWMIDSGVHQWQPQDFTEESVRDVIRTGNVWIAWQHGAAAGTVSLFRQPGSLDRDI